MHEKLLQFIWQHRYYDNKNLRTTDGRPLSVIKTGIWNNNNGPDFKEAQIQIDQLTWFGSVEVHQKSSDWYAHAHNQNMQYNNVILHVVWQHDTEVLNQAGVPLPTLELKHRVGMLLLERYELLMNAHTGSIPCAPLFPQLAVVRRSSMLMRATVERFERKAEKVLQTVKACEGDWVEAFYRMLCKYMGSRLNEDAFEAISMQLPYRLVVRHKGIPQQFEALFYGISGLVQRMNLSHSTSRALLEEYSFLAHKYGLRQISELWNFSKIRPANSPQVRIQQLARLVYYLQELFDGLVSCTKESYKYIIEKIKKISVLHDNGWSTQSARMGDGTVYAIIINVLIPMKAAWLLDKDQRADFVELIDWLEAMPGEQNFITKKWAELDWKARHALESQGQIELYQSYCTMKRCLQCGIGTGVLNISTTIPQPLTDGSISDEKY